MGARENKCPEGALLLVQFLALSLTLVPRSLLRNRTETLATQASGLSELFFCFFFPWCARDLNIRRALGTRNLRTMTHFRFWNMTQTQKSIFFLSIFVPGLLAGWVKVGLIFLLNETNIEKCLFASTSKQINDKNDLLCLCQMSNKLFTSESSQLKNASCIHTRLINT